MNLYHFHLGYDMKPYDVYILAPSVYVATGIVESTYKNQKIHRIDCLDASTGCVFIDALTHDDLAIDEMGQ